MDVLGLGEDRLVYDGWLMIGDRLIRGFPSLIFKLITKYIASIILLRILFLGVFMDDVWRICWIYRL